MMQGAECEAVRNLVGTACFMPLDMSSLEGNGAVVQTNGEFAHSAAIAVGVKHRWGERWISRSTAEPYKPRFNTSRLQNFVMKCPRKVGFDERTCESYHKPIVVAQQCKNSFGETALGI